MLQQLQNSIGRFLPPRNKKPCHSLGSNSKKKKLRENVQRPAASQFGNPETPENNKNLPANLRLFCPRKVKLSKKQRTRKAKVNDIGTLLNIGLVYRYIYIHAVCVVFTDCTLASDP